MAEFAYNNPKYADTEYTPFKLNWWYHPCVFYEENVDSYSKSKVADTLTKELKNLIASCRENLQHTQELQKRAHDKGAKPKNYAPSEKAWLNSKYIKTKCNQNLEAKFFRSFRVLHPVSSQAYKLKLPK